MPQKTRSLVTKLKQGTTLSPQLIIVFNPKGGVGKTTVTRGVAYALSTTTSSFTLVDTDHENPDLLKEHGIWSRETEQFEKRRDDIDVFYVGVKTEEDFAKLGDKIQTTPGTLLINTPAGSGNELLTYWMMVLDIAVATGHSTTILVPLDRGRDSLESLRDLVEVMEEQDRPNCRVVVLKNSFFGKAADFHQFDGWAKGHMPTWMSVQIWPNLSKVVVDRLASERATLNGCDSLTMMERAYLQRYQRSIVEVATEIGVIDA